VEVERVGMRGDVRKGRNEGMHLAVPHHALSHHALSHQRTPHLPVPQQEAVVRDHGVRLVGLEEGPAPAERAPHRRVRTRHLRLFGHVTQT